MINPEWTRCVVALGTNLGDRQDIAFRALADVAATEGFRVVASSSLHETVALTPNGFDSSAPGYLNQVLVLESAWSPQRTLDHLLAIETAHGRVREAGQYADRTLDLDLITYGDLIHHSESLTLPHPRAHQRRFVLEPWLEIDPQATIPEKGKVAKLLGALPTTS
ncbi:MAG TPA: 2-amino-4-hydroxy-6-hydroxymethyldihydropteridine diphosphokinase [Microbacteriaceae bacterium]|nr:2-amino-4-hydroxy-6-hydroxymethyldihydropteridine diphosphokinase [Microbacteriaceae bacterium]